MASTSALSVPETIEDVMAPCSRHPAGGFPVTQQNLIQRGTGDAQRVHAIAYHEQPIVVMPSGEGPGDDIRAGCKSRQAT